MPMLLYKLLSDTRCDSRHYTIVHRDTGLWCNHVASHETCPPRERSRVKTQENQENPRASLDILQSQWQTGAGEHGNRERGFCLAEGINTHWRSRDKTCKNINRPSRHIDSGQPVHALGGNGLHNWFGHLTASVTVHHAYAGANGTPAQHMMWLYKKKSARLYLSHKNAAGADPKKFSPYG
jgi:hypothetical protein